MSLLTIGTVAFDDIETPFGKVEKVIGGACTYASYAASYFTDNIRLCSIVGADFPADEIKNLENRGVDMEGLQIKQDGLVEEARAEQKQSESRKNQDIEEKNNDIDMRKVKLELQEAEMKR